jgi:hypothetical protein
MERLANVYQLVGAGTPIAFRVWPPFHWEGDLPTPYQALFCDEREKARIALDFMCFQIPQFFICVPIRFLLAHALAHEL